MNRKRSRRIEPRRPRLLVGLIAVAVLCTPAYAVLRVIENSPTKPVAPPAQVIPEGARLQEENARLRAELDRLNGELVRVKSDLDAAQKSEPAADAKVARINQRLDDIEQRMEEVGSAILRINFDFGSSTFHPPKDVAAALVNAGKKASKVNVRGYTDNIGTDAANRALALQRALSAKRYLIDHGVQRKKVAVFAEAASSPIGDNSTDDGRALNRRVEIEFRH